MTCHVSRRNYHHVSESKPSKSEPTLTVCTICCKATLTERYFYESFSDCDEFVPTVYDNICMWVITTFISAKTPQKPSKNNLSR